ncbi:type IV pilus biogenesis protein PilP [Trinickia fusca]|uniref:Type IV pilus biogenesis protein PilP n=2 Tax=Trinickia fusca TaxID=2419777 RepID=A0A494XAH4_9BURK|nr:type IV pilus biogenesis protein PilP [Trinickia fusca]
MHRLPHFVVALAVASAWTLANAATQPGQAQPAKPTAVTAAKVPGNASGNAAEPAPAAQADALPPSPEAAATVAALTRLEGETVVLKAELKKLETQTQIAQRAAELSRLNGGAGPEDVRVVAVEGIGAKLYATLVSRNEGQYEVKAGDTLPNGMKILSIKSNAVYAQSRSGAKVQLPMLATWSDASSFSGSTGGDVAGVPPLPSMSLPRN